MKKNLALILAIVLILTMFTACGTKPAASPSASAPAETASAAPATSAAPAAAKQLTACLGPDTETIDPALNTSVDGGNYILFAFDCLLLVDKDGKLTPGCAEKWEATTDGLTWTFHLRQGLKWSDGSALTANDFVYSWKRVVDPNTAAPYAQTVLGMVKGFDEATAGNIDALGVAAPDDNTFVVTLAHPCAYFDKLAAFNVLAPVNKATIEKNGDAWATKPESYICNGAFFIKEWVPGSYILFEKNPNYWDAANVKLDSMKMLLIEDPNATLAAYQSGSAMMVKNLPGAEVPSLKSDPNFHLDPTLGTYCIALNDSIDMFKDARVRTALSLVIDRKYVAETLMGGTYTPAPNFVGTGVSDWDGSAFMANANGGKPYIDINDMAGNLEKAKQLLADAGYPDGKGFPTITYSVNDASFHKIVAEYIQQAWAQLGLTVNVEVVEWKAFLPQRRAGDYQVSRWGWLFDYNDASNMMELLMSTNGNDDMQYKNPAYDDLMNKAAAEPDAAKRSAILHQAEDLIMSDTAVIPVAYYNDFYLIQPNVTGYYHLPNGQWVFQYADLT